MRARSMKPRRRLIIHRRAGYRSYANGSLVSSKQLTCFSDFRMPLDSSDHMTLPAYVQYLEDYVAHFRLRQRATFRMSTRVCRVRRADGGGHIVRWRQLDSV